MIKRTIITFLVLMTAYLVLMTMIRPTRPIAQHQWQDNQIKAESYIYATGTSSRNVIVGSSLSCRLFMDSLPGFTSLAFNGQSIFDGLTILSHKTELPDNVFIEMNFILRDGNNTFTENLFNPVLYGTRAYVPALRDGYQPLAITGSYLTVGVRAALSGVKSVLVREKPAAAPAVASAITLAASPAPAPVANPVASELFGKMVSMQIGNYSRTPDGQLLESRFHKLYTYVDLLRKKGVKVCFFEMPVDEHLCQLPLSNAIRQGFYQVFPPDKYNYLPQPGCAGYETSDGLHLKDPDALRYTLYFRSWVNTNLSLQRPL